MSQISAIVRRPLRIAVAIALSASLGTAADVTTPRLYAVTTETGMPNLEENLRYTTTHEQRCLAREDLASAFPILQHSALNGCSLGAPSQQGDTLTYALICSGGHGTTGHATWELGASQLTGTLNVKLGGKNMTFYQRITATAVWKSQPDPACKDSLQ